MNDIWQGPSWASMEFGGRWKPLHYTVRRAYAPIVSNFLRTSDDTFQLWFVNDLREDVTVSYKIEAVSWSGAPVSQNQNLRTSSVRVPANSSWMATEMMVGELDRDVCDETTCFIKATAMGYKDIATSTEAENLYNSYLFLSPMKDAKLVQNPVISTSNFV